MAASELTADECAKRAGMTREAWLEELRAIVVKSFDDGDALELRSLDEAEVGAIERGLRELDRVVVESK